MIQAFFSNFPPEQGPYVDYKRLSNWLIKVM